MRCESCYKDERAHDKNCKYMRKTSVSAVASKDGVIKQLFIDEIDRMNEFRNILIDQGKYKSANKVYYQMLGVQAFWAKLSQKGIAL